MKLLIAMVSFLALINTASASSISFNSGDFKFTGDTYIDVTLPSETRAVGRITTITQGSNIIWSTGTSGEYLNFLAYGITPVISPTAPTFNFVGTGGGVDFFLSTSDILDLTVTYDVLSPIISAGSLFLSTLIHGDIIGTATNISYSANGFLDVIGGSYASILNTNSRVAFDNALADISFGLVGSNNQNTLVNSNYKYITSSDAQGFTNPIPEPLPLVLIGMGLLAVGSIRFKNS